MTTYYLQNQMITKLSEQSTMEEQINLSPQKSYTPNGSEYFQESISFSTGVDTEFPYARYTDFDYMIVENTGTSSVVITSFALAGSIADVEISTSVSGELKAGAASLNHTNYAYKVIMAAGDLNDIRNVLAPIAFSQNTEFPSQPLVFKFTESGGTARGPFFPIEIKISGSNYQFDLFALSNQTLNAATGYKLDVFLPQAQVIPSKASVVIPGGDAMAAFSPGNSFIQSLAASAFPYTSGTTSPGGSIKITGIKA